MTGWLGKRSSPTSNPWAVQESPARRGSPRRLCRAFLALALILIASLGQADQGPYDVALQHNVMVPMRDGVRLATDVYLPAKDGQPLAERLPTILMRTPVRQGPGEKGHADGHYFARYGYAVVFQDTRGRYDSEGIWHMLAGRRARRLRHGRLDRPAAAGPTARSARSAPRTSAARSTPWR